MTYQTKQKIKKLTRRAEDAESRYMTSSKELTVKSTMLEQNLRHIGEIYELLEAVHGKNYLKSADTPKDIKKMILRIATELATLRGEVTEKANSLRHIVRALRLALGDSTIHADGELRKMELQAFIDGKTKCYDTRHDEGCGCSACENL